LTVIVVITPEIVVIGTVLYPFLLNHFVELVLRQLSLVGLHALGLVDLTGVLEAVVVLRDLDQMRTRVLPTFALVEREQQPHRPDVLALPVDREVLLVFLVGFELGEQQLGHPQLINVPRLLLAQVHADHVAAGQQSERAVQVDLDLRPLPPLRLRRLCALTHFHP